MWAAPAWNLLLIAVPGVLWATGHPLIAVVVLIWYFPLAYLLSLAVALERFRRRHQTRRCS
jgi:hypothetical protein